MLFLLFSSVISFGSIVDKVFKDIQGKWDGSILYSPNADEIITSNISVNIKQRGNDDFLLLKIKSTRFVPKNDENEENIDENDDQNQQSLDKMRFFIKKHQEFSDRILISDKFDEDIAEVVVKKGYEDHDFIIRGLLKPKNDQITISLETSIAAITISDQFSSNISITTLRQEFKNLKITLITKVLLYGTVIVTILVAIYKMSDLSDVIPSTEGKEALAIKQYAQQQEKLKQAKAEEEKKKKQSKGKTESKPKAE